MQVSRSVHRAQMVEEHRKKQVFCASRQKKTDIFRYFLRSVVENDPLNPFFRKARAMTIAITCIYFSRQLVHMIAKTP